jgi:hypothetical protein
MKEKKMGKYLKEKILRKIKSNTKKIIKKIYPLSLSLSLFPFFSAFSPSLPSPPHIIICLLQFQLEGYSAAVEHTTKRSLKRNKVTGLSSVLATVSLTSLRDCD